ncbi:MAG: hypothetical protein EOP48_05245 [Sphingobacteriales bacterium]|nr:MAG: hypothetical protein EOP48_05245 [Sphingobacteriales bacterium]
MNELMTTEKLENCFETHGSLYTNRNGVYIEFTDQVSTRIQLWDEGPTTFTLYLELPAETFTQELGIQNWADVDSIDEADLWAQYRKGNGYVWADLDYLGEADLVFKVKTACTLITSEKLGYKDEVAGAIDDINALRAYVREHIKALYAAAD